MTEQGMPAPGSATGDPEALVRRSTILVVILVAVGAAVVSYRHAYDLVRAHGETGWTAWIGPATVDGLIYAAGMVLLSAARRGIKPPTLAYVGLALGIVATIGANVAHGWAHGVVGSLVSAWPALALIISYELLMRLVRSAHDEPVPVDERQEETGPPPCPHGVAGTAQDAAVTAFLHARDCLGEDLSQRHLSAAFGVDRKKLAAALKEVALPGAPLAGDEAPVPSLNGHHTPEGA